MRYKEFANYLVEDSTIPAPAAPVPVTPVATPAPTPKAAPAPKAVIKPKQTLTPNPTPGSEETSKPVTKSQVEDVLRSAGYEDFKPKQGNKIQVLVQIPSGRKAGEFRQEIIKEILGILQTELPEYDPQYSPDTGISSLGGVVFDNSPVTVTVKDTGEQGDNAAGVANELELASIIQSAIQKYKRVNVTFVDPRGKKLTISNCNQVDIKGRDTAGRKKSDITLLSDKSSLPISIKKLNADMWESADTLFGKRAREILDKLVAEGTVELKKIGKRKLKTGTVDVFQLSKEIVIEPTEEEALDALFGRDLHPEGGIVIQTFKPEHFKQKNNNITVDAHAIITNAEDIPESHLMVWQLRNDKTRNSETLGIAGIRPLGVTLTRGIGKTGTKDVILVDKNGNVVKNPNIK